MNKIMILGAGTYQVPLIETAKRLGYYTIVVSIPGNYRGFDLADKTYKIDTRDCEKILRVAQREKIDGICTSGTDVAVRTIGYVCDEMGLNGISFKAANILTDKALMKEAFSKGGVSASRGMRAYSLEDAKRVAEKLGYPVVVKRVDGSGSRGITVVKKQSELKEAYNYACEESSKRYVLVESYINGTEIGVDGFVQNGEIVFLAPHGKFVYSGKTTNIPIGHEFPYQCSDVLYNELFRQIQRAVLATGANQCSINADVFVDGNQVSIIEIGGRTGATCIPELISTYYGFDFYEKILRNSLGEKVSFESKEQIACMAKLLFSPIDGKITDIDEGKIDAIRNEGVKVKVDCSLGENVCAMINGTNRIGHVIASVSTEAELEEIIRRINACIWVDGKSLKEIWDNWVTRL